MVLEGVIVENQNILAMILGGGRGSRLYPLTMQRSKPAVPMAGKYRLIDIPISNCINSGIIRIAVLTQFNSISLHKHIVRTYNFDMFHTGWVQIWAAEQTVSNADWYQGTADAVRKHISDIQVARPSHVLILAGDHLYRMDYSQMAKFHDEKKADITIAVRPVTQEDAGRFGLLKRNKSLKITDFVEKPSDAHTLQRFVSRDEEARPYLGSMGIYLFNTDVLLDLLESTDFDDFGSQVIPAAIKTHQVYGFDFDGFWEDIGTIRSFYDTNLALTGLHPPFKFIDQEHPIYSHPRFLPGSTIEDSDLQEVLLGEGCWIERSEIRHSVIGLRSQIRTGAVIRNSILMGNDYYEDSCPEGGVPLGIGPGCEIEGAIIDKNARIGRGTMIKSFPRGTDIDGEGWVVRDGIVVIPKNTQLAPGTCIRPPD